MATTFNSDMVIYDPQVQTAYLERLQDNLEVFNGASNGALVLRSEAIPGDFDKSSFFTVPGGMAHRDVNSSAAATAQKIGTGENVAVKTPWKFGPYETTEEAFKRIGASPEQFSQLLGQWQADKFLEYSIAMAFAALDAAIGTVAAMNVTGSIATEGKKTLTKVMRTFGDKSSRISMLGMSSSTYFDYVDEAIDNKVYEEAGTVIYGGVPGTMGKPVLVSDKIADGKVHALQPGAVQIVESQAPGGRSYDIDGRENLMVGYQAEGAFNIEVLGYSYTDTGSNPDATAIGAGANWTKTAQDNKMTAGAILTLS